MTRLDFCARRPIRRLSVQVALLLLVGVAAISTAAVGSDEWQAASPEPSQNAAPQPLGAISIDTELITGGVDDGVVITHAGDGSGRLFIVEQEGIIRIFSNGQFRPTPFLDISNIVLCCSERGLLGLAFDPDYDVNGFFYVDYTDNSGDTVIARYSVSATNPNRAQPNSAVVLKSYDQPQSNHNGGGLAFGPDGHLYVGSGDGGGSGDPDDLGQDLSTLLGKMLRLDVDSPPAYIPVDNPFVGDPGALDEIWSYGLRNPWRFSFDRLTGDLLIGDVGQSSTEEIDFQPASSSGGENWGWKVLEGTSCHSNSPPGACTDFLTGGSDLPVLEYTHSGGNCSVSGGYRYRGSAYPDLVGVYFYADYCSGRIWGATEDAPGIWSTTELLDTTFLIGTFGEDEDGEIYFSHLGAVGEIYRIVSTAGGGDIPCEDIRQLQTRCVAVAQNNIQARVLLTDTSHSGETVTLSIDGNPNIVTIVGDRAQIQEGGAASGLHTVSLDDPASCVSEVEITCP